MNTPLIAAFSLFCLLANPAYAITRTVHECWKDGTASVSTIPEPGSRCTTRTFEDGPRAPALWKNAGLHKGTLYSFESDGKTGTTTRKIPGAKALFNFTIRENEGLPAPVEPGSGAPAGPPIRVKARMGVFDSHFKSASKRHRVDEAYLRAVAHAESAYQSNAVSSKGAMGVMQLMPATATQYGVKDPFAPAQSINAGARHLAYLLGLYKGDRTMAAAAYNAGIGAVSRYKGVPPFPETRTYVRRVDAFYHAYRAVLNP